MSEPRQSGGWKDERRRVSRRTWLRAAALTGTAAAASAAMFVGDTVAAEPAEVPTHANTFALLRQGKKIPVIFDSDIGGDIDDTWALVYLMKCPELDVKLLVSDAGNTIYRRASWPR